jgi:hypothetical protein
MGSRFAAASLGAALRQCALEQQLLPRKPSCPGVFEPQAVTRLCC